MITREELLRSPEYWFEGAQNELYNQVVRYMESEQINRTELAERLGVTKGYVSQILNGNFNYTLKRLIDLALAIGLVPRIEYQNLESMIKAEKTAKPKRISTKQRAANKIRTARKRVNG
jgi:transcriptional regulator with XRE-family HTH domain